MSQEDAHKFHKPWIIVLTLVNGVYGAFIASVQTDFKYVIGFSSVSHMGLVAMGFATLNRAGMLGAGIQMFSHGIMTALFFAVVGMVYDQAHTREIPRLGGFRKIMPLVALALIIVQEMSARLGVVTGKGLADLIRESLGVRLTAIIIGIMLIANLANTVSEFAGVAASLEIFGVSKDLSVPVAAAVVWLRIVKAN